jgi:predicted transcriptional regulator
MASPMRKSKLELYQEILERLKGKQLSLDCLSFESGMDCAALRRRVDFLIQNGLVKEKVLKTGSRFAISAKGLAVLKALDLQRHFDVVRTTVMAVEGIAPSSMAMAKQQPKRE